jgi:2-iminobutanoate/2-iminopropanoate deaminase
MKKALRGAGVPAAIGPYSAGIESDGAVYCSGQLGLDPATGHLVDGVAAQTERALENLGALLAIAGLTLADVVKTTVFVVDLADFGTINDIYARHFAEPHPARSTVQVAALPKGGLVEIEAIAERRR